MKMNMIIGKKQILLAALVVVLGAAVYINYRYAAGSDLIRESDTAKNYGDTQLVDTNVENEAMNENAPAEDSDYFASARLSREKSRDEAVETMARMMENGDTADEVGETALQITTAMEKEADIESLVRAKGFTDCIAYVDADTISVVVQAESLESEQIAQIRDIVLGNSDIAVENIKIVATK